MSLTWASVRTLRILDFDTECRPMHYSEFRSEDQITGIAWSWVGSAEVRCEVLEQDLSNERSMLEAFLADFDRAGMVTGHYIRKHDMPLIVDHCIRLGLPLLGPKLMHDTMETVKVKGLGKSQENLAATFGLDEEKHHMNGHRWRVANSLDAAGREGTRTRVTTDVIQHKAVRAEALRRGMLRAPRAWTP